MLRARGGVAVTTVMIALAACSSYGASETPSSGDAGTSSSSSSSSGGSSSGGSSSGATSSGGTDSGSGDASDDGSTFGEACPPCSGTCVPAGCSGAGPNVTCTKPYDVSASQTLIVFACPEGPTTTLPNQPACGNGGPKHGAPLRLGSATNGWKVTVTGSNPFVIVGDCTNVGAGSCSTSSASRDVPSLANVFVGTSTTNLASCAQLGVALQAL